MRKWIPRALGGILIGLVLVLGATAVAFVPGTSQITDNSARDDDPAISGSNLVWVGNDGNDDQIYFWDGVTITNVSNNSTDDRAPAISGSNVVWRRWDGYNDDMEIYFMRGAPRSFGYAIPAISPGGLALLAGLVLGIVAWARRGG